MKEVKRVNYVFIITWFFVRLVAYSGLLDFIVSPAILLMADNFLFAVPMLGYLLFVKKDFVNTVRIKKIRISDIFLCILMYICLNPVLTFLNTISMLYSDNAVSNVMLSMQSRISFPVALLAIAITPAILEELTYRGGYYNTYREVNPLGAILLSGFVFGLMHGNLNQFTYATVLGIIFALIVEATDSLLSTMIVHCLVNSASVVIMYAIPAAFKYIETIYQEAKEAGDVMTVQWIESLTDGGTLSLEALMGDGSMAASDVMAMLPSTFVTALIGGGLAFLLFKTIAKRNNRWEYVRSIFTNPNGIKYPHLITWGLVAGVVVATAGMVVTQFFPQLIEMMQ